MDTSLWNPYDSVNAGTDEAHQEERRWALLSAEGDARAFREIVERHHRGVYRFVARIVVSVADAEDLTQETFARAFVNMKRYDPKYRLSTWLYRIALNLSRDYLRSAKRRERPYEPGSDALDEVESAASPYDTLRSRDQAARLDAALRKLPDTYREVLILKDVEQCTFQEIAVITGCTVAGLKIRAVRARAAMRKHLERMA